MKKDGSTFFVEGRGTKFTYRGEPHTLAVVRDVTEEVNAYDLLQRRVEERTRELSTLLDISRGVTSTLKLEPLLDAILDGLQRVIPCDGAGIMVLEGDHVRFLARRAPTPDEGPYRFDRERFGPILDALLAGEPVNIGDVHADTPLARAYRQHFLDRVNSQLGYVRSHLSVPMVVQDRVIGILSLAAHIPERFTPRDVALATAIGQQASVAIENSRLYEQAQELAVLEERQRLSRELHDSVSQALYSIALGAKTARALADGGARALIDPLDFVLTQADRGLAEMRALLFELRPESLELEGLVVALEKQAGALAARYSIPVQTALCDEPSTSLPVKEALYRITQEALHNAVKHAQPTAMEVRLESDEDWLMLEVRDNGGGFDTSGSFPGHLGLRSMQERAARLGGTLQIESDRGEGTRVRARIPASPGS